MGLLRRTLRRAGNVVKDVAMEPIRLPGQALDVASDVVRDTAHSAATVARDVGSETHDIFDSADSAAHSVYRDMSGQTDREFNEAEAEKQRAWEADQKARSHQIEAADLAAAGFNPLMSAGGSSAGSIPSGSSAHFEGTASAMQGMLGGAFSHSIEAVMAFANAKKISSEADLNSASASKVRAETGKVPVEIDSLGQSIKLAQAQTTAAIESLQNMKADRTLHGAQVKEIDARISELQSQSASLRAQAKLTNTQEQHSALGLSKAKKESDFWLSPYGTQGIAGEHMADYLKGAFSPYDAKRDPWKWIRDLGASGGGNSKSDPVNARRMRKKGGK